MAVTPVRLPTPPTPLTCTGERLLPPVSAMPSWPSLLLPHDHTVPSRFTASEWNLPAEIAITFVSPDTCVGTPRLLLVVSPTSPSKLNPQPHTVPLFLSARL